MAEGEMSLGLMWPSHKMSNAHVRGKMRQTAGPV